VANDVELWLVRHRETGVRMCIDRAEFEMLFRGSRREGRRGWRATRRRGSWSCLRRRVRAGDSRAGEGREAGDRVAEVSVIAPSLRPRVSAADAGVWELIDKVKDASLPAVFKAEDMEHYGLANDDMVVTAGVSRLRDRFGRGPQGRTSGRCTCSGMSRRGRRVWWTF
jgi:hypothetical protein